MRASSKRLFALLFSALLLGYATYLILDVMTHHLQAVDQLRHDQAERLGVRTQVVDAVNKIQTLLATYDDLDKKAKSIGAALPTDQKFAEVLAIIASIASNHGLTLGATVFTETTAAQAAPSAHQLASRPAVGSVEARVSLMGDYSSFKQALADIESELRLMDVKELVVKPIAADSRFTGLNFELRITSYWQPPVESKITSLSSQ